MAQLSDPGLPAVLQALAAAVSGFKAAAVLPPRLGGSALPGNGAAAHPQAQQLLAGGERPSTSLCSQSENAELLARKQGSCRVSQGGGIAAAPGRLCHVRQCVCESSAAARRRCISARRAIDIVLAASSVSLGHRQCSSSQDCQPRGRLGMLARQRSVAATPCKPPSHTAAPDRCSECRCVPN